MKKIFKFLSLLLVLSFIGTPHCFAGIIIKNPAVIRQAIKDVDIRDTDLLDLCSIYNIRVDELRFDEKRMVYCIIPSILEKVSIDIPIVDSNNDVIGEVSTNYRYKRAKKISTILNYFSSSKPKVDLKLARCRREVEYSLFEEKNPIKYDVEKIKSKLNLGNFDNIYYTIKHRYKYDIFGELVLIHRIKPTLNKVLRTDTYLVDTDDLTIL